MGSNFSQHNLLVRGARNLILTRNLFLYRYGVRNGSVLGFLRTAILAGDM